MPAGRPAIGGKKRGERGVPKEKKGRKWGSTVRSRSICRRGKRAFIRGKGGHLGHRFSVFIYGVQGPREESERKKKGKEKLYAFTTLSKRVLKKHGRMKEKEKLVKKKGRKKRDGAACPPDFLFSLLLISGAGGGRRRKLRKRGKGRRRNPLFLSLLLPR